MKFLKLFNENIEADNFYKAALHYFNNDLNKDTALEYINNAIEIKNDPKYIDLKLKIENKVIFSSNEDQLEAIKELGEARFAYLSDDNFVFRAVLSKPDSILIALYINEFTEERVRPNFNWFDVKDYFIPFMQNLLSAGFEINYVPKGKNERGISFNYNQKWQRKLMKLLKNLPISSDQGILVEDILEDKVEDQTINAIFVYVKSAYFIP